MKLTKITEEEFRIRREYFSVNYLRLDFDECTVWDSLSRNPIITLNHKDYYYIEDMKIPIEQFLKKYEDNISDIFALELL